MSGTYVKYPFVSGSGGGGGSGSWRAPVANAAALPGGGNTAGDAIAAEDTGTVYVWNGSSWIAQGSAAIAPFDNGSVSGAVTINWTNSPIQLVTLTGNAVFTFSNVVTGQAYSLTVIQDATAGRTATWAANVRWPSQTAPTLTTSPYFEDVFSFLCLDSSDVIGGTFAGSVRPSTAPAPPDPSTVTGLILWFDGSDSSSMTAAGGGHPGNGSKISQWNDKSSNAFNATQATGASQPVFVSSALNHQGGVAFNGSAFMNLATVPDPPVIPFWGITSANPTSYYFVMANTAYTGSAYHGNVFNARDHSGFNKPINIVDSISGQNQSINIGAVGPTAVPPQSHGPSLYAAPFTATTFHKVIVTFTGDFNSASNYTLTLDGTLQSINSPGYYAQFDTGSPTAAGTEQFIGCTIGGSLYGGASQLNGTIVMFCCYDHILTTPQIAVLDTYVNALYGI